MDIFDECPFEYLVGLSVADGARDGVKPRLAGGAQAAFTSD